MDRYTLMLIDADRPVADIDLAGHIGERVTAVPCVNGSGRGWVPASTPPASGRSSLVGRRISRCGWGGGR